MGLELGGIAQEAVDEEELGMDCADAAGRSALALSAALTMVSSTAFAMASLV